MFVFFLRKYIAFQNVHDIKVIYEKFPLQFSAILKTKKNKNMGNPFSPELHSLQQLLTDILLAFSSVIHIMIPVRISSGIPFGNLLELF